MKSTLRKMTLLLILCGAFTGCTSHYPYQTTDRVVVTNGSAIRPMDQEYRYRYYYNSNGRQVYYNNNGHYAPNSYYRKRVYYYDGNGGYYYPTGTQYYYSHGPYGYN